MTAADSVVARRLRLELAELERQRPNWIALAAAARLILGELPEESEDLQPVDFRRYPIRSCGCRPLGRHRKDCGAIL